MIPTANARLDFPATRRNQDAILDVLEGVMDGVDRVLEVGAGSGQHAAHLAAAFPNVAWQPSDPDPLHRASIAAWTEALPNVAPSLDLDAASGAWPDGPFDLVVSINMIHIAPWPACLGLLAGSGKVLSDGGRLYLYGPFMENGRHTADSNARFDASLRLQNPDWGVRDLDAVVAAAAPHGLTLDARAAMPANNLSVFFRRHVSAQ